MNRALVGGVIGFLCGGFAVTAFGAWYGYENGVPSARLGPGLEAACTEAFAATMFLGPVPAACGAVIGALAGFGSWLVRPRGRRSANAVERGS